MNKKVYMFNIGMDEVAQKNKVKLESMGFDVEIGPTFSDKKELRKSNWYARAEKEGLYAFMSDYYRFWKLYNDGGVYMDLSTDIKVNAKSKKMLEKMFKSEFHCFKSNDVKIETAIISGKRNNSISARALEILENVSYDYRKKMSTNVNSPNVLTLLYLDENPPLDFESFSNENITVESFKLIRDHGSIFKYGLASWKDGNDGYDWWENQEMIWNQNKSTYRYEMKEVKKTRKAIVRGCKWINKNKKG